MGATSSCPPWPVSAMPLYLSSGRPAFPRDNTLFNWHYLLGKAATASDALLQDITQQRLCLMLLRSQWGGKAGGALLSEGSNDPRAAAAHEGPAALNPSATKELKPVPGREQQTSDTMVQTRETVRCSKWFLKEGFNSQANGAMLMFTYHPHRQQKQKLLKMVCQTKLFNVHNTWPCRCSEYKKFKNIRNPW